MYIFTKEATHSPLREDLTNLVYDHMTNHRYTTLQRTMTTDMGYKNWKPTKVQYLPQEDYQTRVHCCQQILDKYDNSTRRDKLFSPTNVLFMLKAEEFFI
jgi:hypothetical protein